MSGSESMQRFTGGIRLRIAFVSNFFNHHQAYISDELYELTGGNYRFIETSPMPQERKTLGYAQKTMDYVLRYGEDEQQNALVMEWIDTADAVIIGSAPEELLKNRKKNKKMIVRYSERPLKKGFQLWKYPLRWLKWHLVNPAGIPIYMLCASAYTAQDYARFGLFKNRSLKWGYFPECRRYDDVNRMIAQKDTKQILWCGRFLDWKHPDDVLTAAHRLKEEGYDFRIRIIGTGEMESELQRMAEALRLQETVSFAGSMSPEEVRAHMEHAGIYLFTSDRKEGWGAVLNEAMNSGCAVIASRDAGATPYLIEDGKNGLVYQSGDTEALTEAIRMLLDHPEMQTKLGAAAYSTIERVWNPQIAAQRLAAVLEILVKEEAALDQYADGPCSRA